MALKLETFVNFESGTFHECVQAEGVPVILTDPAPPYEHETYVARLSTAETAGTIHMPAFTPGGNKYVIGCRIRFHNTGNPLPVQFFTWYGPEGAGSGNQDFYLTYRGSDNRLRVYDANGALVATSGGSIIVSDTWHLMELLFTHGDPGDLIVHVDGVEVLNTTGEDYDGTA